MVDGLSFEVRAGEIFGLLGPNGAGKTSTIEVLEGLEQPDAGSVSVLGMDVRTQAHEIKERIGVQLQSTGLPRYLNVYETLDLFRSFYPRRTGLSVETLMDRLGLEPLRKRLNSRLSGGERQRLALALALVNNPDILFLDEPSTGLDPHGRRELWAVIKEWQADGKTVFLTTHDMHEAETLCDRVGIMDGGRIVALDSVSHLLGEQADEQAIWVQANGRSLPENFGALLPAVSRYVAERDGALLYSTDAVATMAGLLDLRKGGQATFGSVQIRSPSLEDVFLRHTGRRLEG